MARLHLRVKEQLARQIDEMAAAGGATRTQVVLELIQLGLEVRSGAQSSSADALRQLNARLEDWAELTAQGIATVAEQARLSAGHTDHKLDRLTRLGVESIMILRRLAQLQGPQLLTDAQAATREFVREQSVSGPHSTHDSLTG